MKRPLHQRLFGYIKTDMLHLLMLGNSISLAPGLVGVIRTGVPSHWLTWLAAGLQLVAVGMLASIVVLELQQWRTRADRRRFLDIPWPATPAEASQSIVPSPPPLPPKWATAEAKAAWQKQWDTWFAYHNK
jgi:hypothetical protein